MSDHVSGPRAIGDPVADITDVYAFPCPESPQHLVLIMNVFPFAGPSACYSDAIIYRIRVRPVTIASTGHTASYAVRANEAPFDFSFEVPAKGSAGQMVQQGRCTTPSGAVIPLRVNDEKGARGEGVHVFVGQRSDPFFLDGDMARKTMATRQIAFK